MSVEAYLLHVVHLL